MAKKIFTIADRIIEYSFYLLFFLVPLIFIPANFELFEFSKMILVYLLTIIITAAWLLKMISARKVLFKRSFWDIPLLFFLLSQVLSTLFSMDARTSIWGYYSRAHGGLLSTISYLLLYWAFVSNAKYIHINNYLKAILASASSVAAYGILEHFGIDKNYWAQDVQNRVFSTLGQPNWLAAYLVALAPLTWGLALKSKIKVQKAKLRIKNQKILNFHSYFLFLIFYLCLLYTKSRSGLTAFAVSYFIFWFLSFLPKPKAKKTVTFKPILKKFLIFTVLILVLILSTNNPAREKLFVKLKKTAPAETPPGILVSKSTDIRKIVWQGAIDIWRHYPIFGSGTETFAYSYYNFRPIEHNLVSEWDFLYNKAHNEYLNLLATTGSVGLAGYLLLIISFLFYSFKNIKRQTVKPSKFNHLQIGLLAGFVSILITNFFGFSVVVIGLFFFLFPAISLVLSRNTKGVGRVTPLRWKRTYTSGRWPCLLIGITLLFAIGCLLFIIRIWFADINFAKASKLHSADEYQKSLDFIQKAIKLNPREPLYHDKFGLITANLAQMAFDQEESTLSAQLAQLAIDESSKAIKANPYHVNFWKNRTRIFLKLANLDPDFKLDALQSLIQANQLAPTDAKISYNIALLYHQLDQKQTAIQTLVETIAMKPNYKQARFALALYYQKEGKTKEAIEQLNYIVNSIDPTDEEIKKLIKDWQNTGSEV